MFVSGGKRKSKRSAKKGMGMSMNKKSSHRYGGKKSKKVSKSKKSKKASKPKKASKSKKSRR